VQIESRGFSLIEVLIATVISVVALTCLAQLFIVASAANRASRVLTFATILARDKMEELLAGEAETESGTDFIGARGERLGGATSQPPGTAFVRHWTVSPHAGFPFESRVLTVWITPPSESIELARLVAARGGTAP
jgi:prepilin-type N-terminal cleavage/methylation domain-containing protein